ncbi:MAG: hypothetical protein WAT74_09665, partial [Flavobacteriales bacterium]
MDSLGNVISAHYYASESAPCNNVLAGVTSMIDGEALLWGAGSNFAAIKLDSSGQPDWSRRFNNMGGFRTVKSTPNGDLLMGINLNNAGAVVARMAPDGSALWSRSYFGPRGMIAACLVETDDSFIITGYTDSLAYSNPFIPLPTNYQPKLFMMKLNGSGEVQWCRGFLSTPDITLPPYGGAIVKSNDGGYGI